MTPRTWRLLAWASTFGVLLMCWLPGEELPTRGPPGLDKLAHAGAFLVVAFCWLRAGLSGHAVLALGATLALATELGQQLAVPGRQGDPWDAVADLVGTLLAVVLAPRAQAR